MHKKTATTDKCVSLFEKIAKTFILSDHEKQFQKGRTDVEQMNFKTSALRCVVIKYIYTHTHTYI